MIEDKNQIPGIKYCIRCCFPETVEGIVFDDMGICRSCQSSEQKIHINWKDKEIELRRILNQAKKNSGNNYDCIIPISGGKDSTFQLYVLTQIYKMNPLAVTFNHNWHTKIGFYNLMNCLEVFNVDHIMFTPNRKLINKIAKKSIFAIGDSCWHCHAGIGSFPLHIAQKFGIKLLIWGESIADSSGKASYDDPKYKFDRDYFQKVSAKVTPKKMCESFNFNMKELNMFEPPTQKEIDKVQVKGIHLGDYIFWDDERQTEFVKKYFGWKEFEVEGSYKKYKSAECIMEGVHNFMCYLKRGYGRATWQASLDVRNGLLTREEGLKLIRKHDSEVPLAIEYYKEITNMSEEEFYNVIEFLKDEKIKNINLPVNKNKTGRNPKNYRPFIQEFLKEIRNSNDE